MERKKQATRLPKYATMKSLNGSLFLSLLLFFCCESKSQNQKDNVTKQPVKNLLAFYSPATQFILDSVSCDLDGDQSKDLLLVLDNVKNKVENAQHQAPLPIILLLGSPNGYKQFASNSKIVEDLDDDCSADGYQKVVAKSNYLQLKALYAKTCFMLPNTPPLNLIRVKIQSFCTN